MNIQEQITIKASSTTVFSYMNEVRNRSAYIPMLEEVILLDPPPIQLGSRYVEVATIAGRKLKTTYQVIAFEENKRISVETLKSIFPIRVNLNLQEDGENTIVEIDMDIELVGIFRLAASIVKGIVKQQAAEILFRLKQIIEKDLISQ